MRIMSGPATNVDHLIDECSDLFERITQAGQENNYGAFRAISDIDDVFSIDFRQTKDFEPVQDARSELTSASSVFELSADPEFKYTND